MTYYLASVTVFLSIIKKTRKTYVKISRSWETLAPFSTPYWIMYSKTCDERTSVWNFCVTICLLTLNWTCDKRTPVLLGHLLRVVLSQSYCSKDGVGSDAIWLTKLQNQTCSMYKTCNYGWVKFCRWQHSWCGPE